MKFAKFFKRNFPLTKKGIVFLEKLTLCSEKTEN